MQKKAHSNTNRERSLTTQSAISAILQSTGTELSPEVSKKTPQRAAKAWMEMTSGYAEDADELINGAYYPTQSQEMVLVRNIRYASLCEHHLLPFIGEIHIAYIPNCKIIGVSKIPRIVNMYARRLQIQERMVDEIAHLLFEKIGACGLAAVATGTHLCTMIRGVKESSASLVTTVFLGSFRDDPNLQNELFRLIALPDQRPFEDSGENIR